MSEIKEIYVEDYMAVTTKLKNGWLLSIGYMDTEYNDLENHITEEELRKQLMYVAEIINDFGVPQIGTFIEDDYDWYISIECLNYYKGKHLHIRVNI